MARKPALKPLFSLKEDFKDSLDEFCNAAMLLHQAVSTALELKEVSEKTAPTLQRHLNRLTLAMVGKED